MSSPEITSHPENSSPLQEILVKQSEEHFRGILLGASGYLCPQLSVDQRNRNPIDLSWKELNVLAVFVRSDAWLRGSVLYSAMGVVADGGDDLIAKILQEMNVYFHESTTFFGLLKKGIQAYEHESLWTQKPEKRKELGTALEYLAKSLDEFQSRLIHDPLASTGGGLLEEQMAQQQAIGYGQTLLASINPASLDFGKSPGGTGTPKPPASGAVPSVPDPLPPPVPGMEKGTGNKPESNRGVVPPVMRKIIKWTFNAALNATLAVGPITLLVLNRQCEIKERLTDPIENDFVGLDIQQRKEPKGYSSSSPKPQKAWVYIVKSEDEGGELAYYLDEVAQELGVRANGDTKMNDLRHYPVNILMKKGIYKIDPTIFNPHDNIPLKQIGEKEGEGETWMTLDFLSLDNQIRAPRVARVQGKKSLIVTSGRIIKHSNYVINYLISFDDQNASIHPMVVHHNRAFLLDHPPLKFSLTSSQGKQLYGTWQSIDQNTPKFISLEERKREEAKKAEEAEKKRLEEMRKKRLKQRNY